jgi:transcriptional regulator with XRE-family HTH domain
MSLSELAYRAGVGKATLSGLEAGTRGNPTVETLYSIAGQLGVPLAAILPEPELKLGEAQVPEDAIHGAAISTVLLETFTDGSTVSELYRLRIRPGQEQTSPPHPPGTVEYLTVFSGTARVGPATAPVIVVPGGHASWTADVPHVYAAEGGEEVQASLLIRSSVPTPGDGTPDITTSRPQR